jgi:hypothetical protein
MMPCSSLKTEGYAILATSAVFFIFSRAPAGAALWRLPTLKHALCKQTRIVTIEMHSEHLGACLATGRSMTVSLEKLLANTRPESMSWRGTIDALSERFTFMPESRPSGTREVFRRLLKSAAAKLRMPGRLRFLAHIRGQSSPGRFAPKPKDGH